MLVQSGSGPPHARRPTAKRPPVPWGAPAVRDCLHDTNRPSQKLLPAKTPAADQHQLNDDGCPVEQPRSGATVRGQRPSFATVPQSYAIAVAAIARTIWQSGSSRFVFGWLFRQRFEYDIEREHDGGSSVSYQHQ